MDKFGVFLKVVYCLLQAHQNYSGNVTLMDQNVSSWRYYFPRVSYDLNDNISLLAQIDGFNIGYVKTTLKQAVNIGGTDVEVKIVITHLS